MIDRPKGFCRQNVIFRSSKSETSSNDTNPKFCQFFAIRNRECLLWWLGSKGFWCQNAIFSFVKKGKFRPSKFRHKTIIIVVTTSSFRHFVSFSSKNEILWSLMIAIAQNGVGLVGKRGRHRPQEVTWARPIH